jgi:RNA polymerase sigma factor (sigma-70 family)
MGDRDHPEWSAGVTAVLERMRPKLLKTLKAYRVPLPDGEDLVQDALLALVTRWEAIGQPGPWLLGAVRHLCRLYVRRRRGSKVAGVDRDQLEQLAGAAPGGEAQQGARLDLERKVQQLSPRQRRLLRLSYGLGLDARELSHVLGGAKPASVRRTRGRALTRLRELMGGEE